VLKAQILLPECNFCLLRIIFAQFPCAFAKNPNESVLCQRICAMSLQPWRPTSQKLPARVCLFCLQWQHDLLKILKTRAAHLAGLSGKMGLWHVPVWGIKIKYKN
jgi:hypothetical protein